MRRIPKKPKGKGKRWAKGHSSSSNPETKKFRDAARSRFFRHDSGGPSNLTVGALKTLDAFNNKKYGLKNLSKDDAFSDETSIDSWASSKTFKTFASDWSDCTNASFNKLLNNFEPKSFIHKEMLAVLAAVTEVIKGNGGKETSTEYYAALITTLGVTEEEDSVAAILSLLSMGIKSVPNEVLRLKFSETSKIFLDLLAKYSEAENPVILRAVIGCLSVTLRAQDPGVWSQPSTLEVFHSILVFSTYSKPRVRKAGQHAVCAILKASSMFTAEETHPAASAAAKYCVQQIESVPSLGGNTTTLHILTLLKEIIGTFPKNYIKLTCETLLKLITLGTAIVTTCSLEVLHGLFISAPPPTRLDPILNAQIINALYDYQPSMNDPQATLAWMTVMQEAHKALSRNEPRLCGENLCKYFTTATNLWLSDNAEIVRGSTACLRVVAMDCLKACSHCPNYFQICRNVFTIVENCLKYQFNNAWIQVFNTLGLLFEIIGKDGEEFMKSSLKTLFDLRESHNFMYLTELDYTIGKSIRALGPECVLKSIPVIVTGNETNYEFRNTWLLPVLKDNIQSSSLKFFIEYFLPMASICERKSKELNANNEKIGAHSYDLIQLQIWSLLPSFCSNAADVKDNFKAIAKTLGDLISSRKHLRIHAMAALRKLIIRNQEKNNKENLEELSRFAKNYLPILFVLYLTKPTGTDESGERLAAYDTIKVYASITNAELCGDLYDKGLKRLQETDKSDLFTRESLMDLLKILIPYQNIERLSITYENCIKILRNTKSKKEEKKYYRLLEVIIGSKSENCKKFTAEKRKEITAFLLKSLKNEKATNRGARLRCIYHMVKILPKGHFNTIKVLIPEAITCCKDINKKTRSLAFKLLEEMFIISRTWSSKSNEEIIKDYISVIVGGLAGTPTLVSATILALGKLTHALKTELPSDVAQLMLENICLLSSLPTREIVGSALGYIKVFITSFPKDKVLPYVPSMVTAIVSMSSDCKSHFRMKTRDILDRLLRKYGYEVIQPLIPADDVIMHKRLKNLKKINTKKKASKSEGTKEDLDLDDMEEFAIRAKPKSIEEILASSDESEDESEVPAKTSKRKDKSQMFIQEDSENIIDFISPSASSKISANKPTERKKKKKDDGFKYTQDGRMIIVDDEENQNSDSLDDDDDNDDSDMDGLSAKLDNVLIGRKRKLSVSSEIPAKYQASTSLVTFTKLSTGSPEKDLIVKKNVEDSGIVEAGGSGIHRPIRQQPESNNSKLEKMKKKKLKKDDMPTIKTGKEYRAKKAKGDVKLKGKPDPFAYIPLSRKMLNRRKKMNNIVKSALKGAKLGTKLKMKKKR